MAWTTSTGRNSFNLPDRSSAQNPEANVASGLRARLQSEDEHPQALASATDPTFPDVFEQFRAGFDVNSTPGNGYYVHTMPDEDDTGIMALREAFAQDGMNLHFSTMARTVKAHTEIQDRIDSLYEESMDSLIQCKKLYDNIVFPLGVTLCHTDTQPRTTILNHLANLRKEIGASIDVLGKLGEEWDQCCLDELDAIGMLTGKTKSARSSEDVAAERIMASFKEEVARLVEDKCNLLTSIEKEYKAEVKVETMTIMQTMLEDSA